MMFMWNLSKPRGILLSRLSENVCAVLLQTEKISFSPKFGELTEPKDII